MKLFDYSCFKPAQHTFSESKNQSCIWSPIFGEKPQPSPRSNHAVCAYDNQIFMYGGRGVKGTINQFWVYTNDTQRWEELFPEGDSPPSLEGHSMVVYDGNIYVFGGETSFASADESPLWQYNIMKCKWTKISREGRVMAPCGRRHHTAVLYTDAMCVYGGYQDLIGPTKEMWLFDFETKSWHFDVAASCETSPDARYGHCATVNNQSMWVCGGLTGLKPNSDVFIWNFELMVWTSVKTKGGPSVFSGHSMCMINNSMYVFGGLNSLGNSSSNMWCLNINEKTWKKCNCNATVKPPAISGHCIISYSGPAFKKKKEFRTRSLPDIKKKKRASSRNTSPSKQRSVSCGKLPNNSQFSKKAESFDLENQTTCSDKSMLITDNCPSEYAYDNPASELSDKVLSVDIDETSNDKELKSITDQRKNIVASGDNLTWKTFNGSENSMKEQEASSTIQPKLHCGNMRYGYVTSRIRHGNIQPLQNSLSSFSYNLIQDSLIQPSQTHNTTETSFIQIHQDQNRESNNIVTPKSNHCDKSDIISNDFPEITTVRPLRTDSMLEPHYNWDMELKPLSNKSDTESIIELNQLEHNDIENQCTKEKLQNVGSSVIAKRFRTQFTPPSDRDITILVFGGKMANVNPNSNNPFCMWHCKLLPIT